LDQVLSRIAALAPMVARLAPDMEQDSVAAAVRLLTRPSMQFCVRRADPLASRQHVPRSHAGQCRLDAFEQSSA